MEPRSLRWSAAVRDAMGWFRPARPRRCLLLASFVRQPCAVPPHLPRIHAEQPAQMTAECTAIFEAHPMRDLFERQLGAGDQSRRDPRALGLQILARRAAVDQLEESEQMM